MLTRPTTEQVLVGIATELRDTIAPLVSDGPATVLLGQIDQILRGLAVRAAHEIAWMHEEADSIAAVTGTDVGWPASLHLDDVVAWYDSVSRVLSGALDEAFAAGDAARVAELKQLLDARSATEMRIVGGFELVGRG
ncbi:MAG: hypothetical protein ACK5CE_14510 [Actinomycetes bacterium]|jgi:hypothetical protein|uniref:Unannotated protein n=1 Tax=freshwater metagenome TaxID=449393 RepID=A0A6J6BJH3_9ZZZZ|nr:hypothetical protein [Actinomycetota bacterium]